MGGKGPPVPGTEAVVPEEGRHLVRVARRNGPEAQHAVAAGLIFEADITTIGAVISGTHPGRTSDHEITLFDGTGVGLQDLAVAFDVWVDWVW